MTPRRGRGVRRTPVTPSERGEEPAGQPSKTVTDRSAKETPVRQIVNSVVFGRARRALTLRVGLALLIAVVVSAYVGAAFERRALFRELERQGGRLADLLASNAANALFAFDYTALENTVQGFAKDTSIRFIQVKDKSGKVVKAKGEIGARKGLVVATREVIRLT